MAKRCARLGTLGHAVHMSHPLEAESATEEACAAVIATSSTLGVARFDNAFDVA